MHTLKGSNYHPEYTLSAYWGEHNLDQCVDRLTHYKLTFLRTWSQESVVNSLCSKTIWVLYADSCPACDPKTNCPFFQKGNCPEIDCPINHPLSTLLCTNWKFQGTTFPGAALYLNFSCPEKDRASKVSQPFLRSPTETAVIVLLSAGQAGMRFPLRWMLKQPHGSAGRWRKGLGIAKQSTLFKRQCTVGSHMWCWVIWHCNTDSCWIECKSWMFF